MVISDSLNFMGELGVFSVIIPFVIVFTVLFAILEKSKLFKKTNNEKAFNSIISLVIALHFIISESRVMSFNRIIIATIFAFLITFLIQLIISMANIENEFINSKYVPIFVLLLSFFSWMYLFGMFETYYLQIFFSWIWQFVVIFGVFFGIVYYVVGGSPYNDDSRENRNVKENNNNNTKKRESNSKGNSKENKSKNKENQNSNRFNNLKKINEINRNNVEPGFKWKP
ncbi:MAG: hypothetical protein ACOCRX_06660 [Candidatus Woesearchaeota archaeon]